MYNLGMVMIGSSGGGSRGSLFSGNIGDNFNAGLAGPIPHPYLGQAQQEYADARAAVALFDQLVERTKRIANQTAREKIADTYGLTDPTNQDKAQYTRNGVATMIAHANSYTPTNYDEFGVREGINRVNRLKSFNKDFGTDVAQAEATYGILPEPQVITKVVQAPGGEATNYIIPAVVVGGGLAAMAALGVFKK